MDDSELSSSESVILRSNTNRIVGTLPRADHLAMSEALNAMDL